MSGLGLMHQLMGSECYWTQGHQKHATYHLLLLMLVQALTTSLSWEASCHRSGAI